ncbi:MAG: hypothetical protein ACKPKO_13460, partial [Candidatus Fonsibacter sp.]
PGVSSTILWAVVHDNVTIFIADEIEFVHVGHPRTDRAPNANPPHDATLFSVAEIHGLSSLARATPLPINP